MDLIELIEIIFSPVRVLPAYLGHTIVMDIFLFFHGLPGHEPGKWSYFLLPIPKVWGVMKIYFSDAKTVPGICKPFTILAGILLFIWIIGSILMTLYAFILDSVWDGFVKSFSFALYTVILWFILGTIMVLLADPSIIGQGIVAIIGLIVFLTCLIGGGGVIIVIISD